MSAWQSMINSSSVTELCLLQPAATFMPCSLESRQSDIRLHEVDAKSVNALTDYAYTGRVQITPFRAQNLTIAVSVFQVR